VCVSPLRDHRQSVWLKERGKFLDCDELTFDLIQECARLTLRSREKARCWHDHTRASRPPEESTGDPVLPCPKLKNVVASSLKEHLVNSRHRSQ
jgi:hypothetical protein